MSTKGCLIVVRRLPYEEPHHAHLELLVRNRGFSAHTDIYCNVSDLRDIGDRYEYRYGSDNPADRNYRLLVLGVYTTDSVGHCAIKVKLNKNEPEPDEGIAEFSISTDPAAVNRLGELFTTFAELQHLEFHWTPGESKLFEKHQPLIA